MRIFSSCSTALICFWVLILLACSAPIAPINVDADGAALKGYDPVAYFTLGHPVKGKKNTNTNGTMPIGSLPAVNT